MFTNRIGSFALLNEQLFQVLLLQLAWCSRMAFRLTLRTLAVRMTYPARALTQFKGAFICRPVKSLAGSAFKVRLESNNVFSTPSTVTDQDGALPVQQYAARRLYSCCRWGQRV